MQAAKTSASKNSRLVMVSFVVMGLLYHGFLVGQQHNCNNPISLLQFVTCQGLDTHQYYVV
jgi:hypothetical protein